MTMELQPWRCVTQQVKGHNVRFFVFSHEQQDVLLREHEDTALGVCDALRKPRLSVPLCLCTRMQSANPWLYSRIFSFCFVILLFPPSFFRGSFSQECVHVCVHPAGMVWSCGSFASFYEFHSSLARMIIWSRWRIVNLYSSTVLNSI